jgi:putative glutamine amidotransferase
MFKFLISQRIVKDAHGTMVDMLERAYTDYFERFGIVLYPVSNFLKEIQNYLGEVKYNGLILSGGGDINPQFYKMSKGLPPCNYFPERDKTENFLIEKMISLKLPILGICHGAQLLNCFFNGRITQNIHKDDLPYRNPNVNHYINIVKPVFDLSGRFYVNHFHNNGIKEGQVADCFDIFAIDSEFDVVEGIIHKDLPIIGIQWHPERMSFNETLNRSLIKNFLLKG